MHIDRLHETIDVIREGCSRHREEITAVNTHHTFDQVKNGMLIKEKLQSVGQRGTLTLIAILQIVTAPRCNCILEEPLEHSRCIVDGLLHSVIHLLPETGNIAHQGRAYHFQILAYLIRIAVDGHSGSHVQTIVGPCLLKDVCQRQKAHG